MLTVNLLRAGFSNPKRTNIKKAAGFATGGWTFF
jgi:hypothetical protein